MGSIKKHSRRMKEAGCTLIFRCCQSCGKEGLIVVSGKSEALNNAADLFEKYPELISFGGDYECCSDECYVELRNN